MFHHDIIPSDRQQGYHSAYQGLAEAIDACLIMFLGVMKEVRNVANADGRDHHTTTLMLMFDFAEALDGVSLLTQNGSAKNCSQLLRTAFEIQLSLGYILESDATYQQRSLAYEYFHHRDKFKWAQRCDPNTQVGKQLRTELAEEDNADVFDLTGLEIVKEQQLQESRMNSARYANVRAELFRMKAAKIKESCWFNLWGGPKSIRDLALHLKQGVLYESLYRSFSAVTHGGSALKRITGGDGNRILLDPIRSPRGLPGMCRIATVLCTGLTFSVVGKVVPHLNSDVRQCYLQEIKPKFNFIDSVEWLAGELESESDRS